jgi:ribonuclease T1
MLGLISRFVLAFLLLVAAVPPLDAHYAARADPVLIARSHGEGARGNGAAIQSISAQDLPAEARATLKLIKEGGPFPYPRDGITFGNRERRLPSQPHGYYREYTVKTPGKRDRGARRIVAGRDGEFYYTDDHYETFRQIKE